MVVQYIIIALILGICLALVSFWVYRTLTDTTSACRGCQLKDACTRHARKQKEFPHGCNRV